MTGRCWKCRENPTLESSLQGHREAGKIPLAKENGKLKQKLQIKQRSLETGQGINQGSRAHPEWCFQFPPRG